MEIRLPILAVITLLAGLATGADTAKKTAPATVAKSTTAKAPARIVKSTTPASAQSKAKATAPVRTQSAAKGTTAPKTQTATRVTPQAKTYSNTRITKGTTKGKAAVRAYVPPRQYGPTPERYKEIQEALISKGYLEGPATGVWDQNSTAAMKKYQEEQKQEPTGKITAKSLITLGLGPKDESNSSSTSSTTVNK